MLKTVKNREKSVEKEEFGKDLQNLKERYGVDFEPSITFPQYNILPEEVQLALVVLKNHKAKLTIALRERETKNGNQS